MVKNQNYPQILALYVVVSYFNNIFLCFTRSETRMNTNVAHRKVERYGVKGGEIWGIFE